MASEAYATAREALRYFVGRAEEERRNGDHEYAETLEDCAWKWRQRMDEALKETR